MSHTPPVDSRGAGFDENVTLALRLINQLMSNQFDRQLYAKEIKMLFRLIEVTEVPPILVKTAPRKANK